MPLMGIIKCKAFLTRKIKYLSKNFFARMIPITLKNILKFGDGDGPNL